MSRVLVLIAAAAIEGCGGPASSNIDYTEVAKECVLRATDTLSRLEAALVRLDNYMSRLPAPDIEDDLRLFEDDKPQNTLARIATTTREGIYSQRFQLGIARKILDGVADHNEIDPHELDELRVCSGGGDYFDTKGLRELADWEQGEKHLADVSQNRLAMDRINKIKESLRAQALRVTDQTDGYGAVRQLFQMRDGGSVVCTTDLSSGRPTFWCEGGTHEKYLK